MNHGSRSTRRMKTSEKPVNQTTIIAGFMMMRSSFRSITLNVSDCSEPAGAAVW